MQGRSHHLSRHRALHVALIAFGCALIALLSGNSPTRIAGAHSTTRQPGHGVGRSEALNHIAVPVLRFDTLPAESLHHEVAELPDTDDDQAEHCLLQSAVVLGLHVPAGGSHMGFHESSLARALTPFRLRAFSTRGSPSA